MRRMKHNYLLCNNYTDFLMLRNKLNQNVLFGHLIAMNCTQCGIDAKTLMRPMRLNVCNSLCDKCLTWSYNLYQHYKITLDKYNELIKNQDFRCAICSKHASECPLPGPRKQCGLVVDHCHATGTVRALVCTHCNRLLGACDDNLELLQKAHDYLITHGASA